MFGGDTLAGFRERLGAVLTGDLRLDRGLSRALAAEAADKIGLGGADALGAVRARLAEWDIDTQWAVVANDERARLIAERVEPYLRGPTLVLGCGDGAVGERLCEMDCPVLLCEREQACGTDRRRHAAPFFPYRGTVDGLPLCETVLVTPAAGSDEDPEALLAVAARTRARRVVLIDTLVEVGCSDEMHTLFQLFFGRCLGDECAAGRRERRTLEGWVSFAESLGRIATIERWDSAPGVPLPHGVFVIDLERSESQPRTPKTLPSRSLP